MTEQRLGPLMVDVAGFELESADREVLRHPMVGGVILFARNYADRDQLKALCEDIHRVRRTPLLLAVDHEGGRVQRFREGFTTLPAVRRIGDVYDSNPERGIELAYRSGLVIGNELAAIGIDLPFAPVLDVDNECSEIIGDRAWHSDPSCIAILAGAFSKGLRSVGIASTGKHFPGHGAVVADSHHELPVDTRSKAEIVERDLRPYELFRDGLVDSVMLAHIVYPTVDERPASLSRRWIMDVLRGELGFKGVVVCDDLNMAGAVSFGSIHDRAEAALEAGCQLLPICNNRTSVEQVLDGLGSAPDSSIDNALASLRCGAGGRQPKRDNNVVGELEVARRDLSALC